VKNLGIIIALLVFVVLLFVVIGLRGGDDKVGVKELKIEKVEKEKVTKLEATLPPKKDDKAEGSDPQGARRVVLEKDGASWKVHDPAHPDKKYVADESQVKGALDAAADLTVGDLIANKADKLKGYEIDEESGLRVKVYTGSAPALDVYFGRAAKGGGSTIRAAGSDDVYLAKGRLGSVMKKDLSAWRKKTLFDAKVEEIARLKTTLADGRSFVVEAGSHTPAYDDLEEPAPIEWTLVEPASLPADFRLDKTQLSRPASAFTSVRAQDFTDGVSDEVAGLDGPHTIVEGTLRDGKTLKLHLGKEDEKKRVYARVEGDPQLYLLASFNAKQLQKSIDDLRDLSLFDVSPGDIERVTFQGATKVVVQRDGEEWKLVEPKKAPEGLDVSQIEGQVMSLVRARATRVDLEAPKDAVAKPGPTIELALKGGKKQTLRFGAALPVEGGGEAREHWAKGGANDLVYVVPAFMRSRYDKPTEIFQKPQMPTNPRNPMGIQPQIPGLEKLPPDVRKKLEESLKKGDFPPPG
jgi:hypothetical protein